MTTSLEQRPGATAPAGAAPAAPVRDGAPETPSGKGAGEENFPVGSILLPARLRPHVARYYAFARAIDDIADNPALRADDKIARLDAFEAALRGEAADEPGFEKAYALRGSLRTLEIPIRHGADLCIAFRQDAVKTRYANWNELMGYCENSANPVGRFLVDLHGEPRAAYGPSDALCTALQVLNHLQDCGKDYRALDRVYIPEDWMAEEGAAREELAREALSPAMRRVLDRMLDETEALIARAQALPQAVRNRRFAMECAVILCLAGRLARRLRRGDPLARRVALSRFDFAACGARGILRGAFGGRPPAGAGRHG